MKLKTNEVINQVKQLIIAGINSWVEAGRIIAREVDEDESFVEDLCNGIPGLTPERVMRFYAIGKEEIHPELLIADGPGCRALLKLPYAVQEKYLERPVDVLIRKGNDWDTLKVDVRNLTGEQAKQAFDKHGVRSTAAQRAFIESENTKRFNPLASSADAYKIVGKRVTMRRDATFTAKDLAKIIAEME